MTVDRILSLGLALLKTRGSSDAYDRLHSFMYSCLIYDQYASEWRQQNKPNTWSQLDSWRELTKVPGLVAQDTAALRHTYHGKVIGDVELTLPVPSLDPEKAGKVAPKQLKSTPTAEYESKTLNLADFIEVAYMVRCNLLHGSYDIRKDDHAEIIMYTALRFTKLVVWMVKQTKWS
jgi:hypothetical protein